MDAAGISAKGASPPHSTREAGGDGPSEPEAHQLLAEAQNQRPRLVLVDAVGIEPTTSAL